MSCETDFTYRKLGWNNSLRNIFMHVLNIFLFRLKVWRFWGGNNLWKRRGIKQRECCFKNYPTIFWAQAQEKVGRFASPSKHKTELHFAWEQAWQKEKISCFLFKDNFILHFFSFSNFLLEKKTSWIENYT